MHWEEGTISEQGRDHHATSDVFTLTLEGHLPPFSCEVGDLKCVQQLDLLDALPL